MVLHILLNLLLSINTELFLYLFGHYQIRGWPFSQVEYYFSSAHAFNH